ncbi:YciI family protein [Nocardioides sp. CER19]|uniref:YciI family protein n=1 Tax=Nocardioides sp. CER19 TaxID=3038538 RepID=UPI002447BBE5|nr:YciI family protein [Nocardioides sp. CER19]MDH2416181.1 YciI family protein [Nocardioides sp. CER19]
MDFLVYSRSVPPSELPDRTAEEDERLNERHWSYMDAFADLMTARGPTLGPDRDSWTGSLHIVDLPTSEAARAFVQDEPYQRAGLFAHHSVSRFTNLLGRTMWECAGSRDEPKFLVLAHAPARGREPVAVDDLAAPWRDVLVVYGALHTLHGEPAGVAVGVHVPSRGFLDELLTEPSMALSAYRDVEVHDWEFGGRR